MFHTHTDADKATLSMRLTRLCLHHVCASSMWQTFLRTHLPSPFQPLAPSLYLLMLLMKFLSFWRFLNFFRAQFACEFAAVCSPKNFVPFACCPSCQSLCPSVRPATASCACLLLHDCHLAVGCPPFNPGMTLWAMLLLLLLLLLFLLRLRLGLFVQFFFHFLCAVNNFCSVYFFRVGRRRQRCFFQTLIVVACTFAQHSSTASLPASSALFSSSSSSLCT